MYCRCDIATISQCCSYIAAIFFIATCSIQRDTVVAILLIATLSQLCRSYIACCSIGGICSVCLEEVNLSVLRLPFLERGKNEIVADLFLDELHCHIAMMIWSYTPEERVDFAMF